jgi:glycosyltransferase involved in cell wall biosynthesis
MNIFGFMIVKDEVDILAQTIESLKTFGCFKKIFIFDNGSSDGTLELARTYESNLIEVSQLDEPFSDNLKFENVYRHTHLLSEGDWFAILDADEIYQEPLLPIIKAADIEAANYIESRSAQFYFTELDLNYEFNPNILAYEQHPYYLLNYGEPRIFRYSEKSKLTSQGVKKRDLMLTKCSRQLLIHHFQFRSSEQTQRRINIRMANNSHSNNWGHINSANWQDYIVPARYLHKYDGNVINGLPDNANLYKIRNNTAYTMANLNWLKRHNYLTVEQLRFFDASRLQRLVRKLW